MVSGAAHHHKRLIHELIEQSHDRVAHVRAGQPIVDVFSASSSSPSSSSTALPPIASPSFHAPHASNVRRERLPPAASLTRLPPASVAITNASNEDDVARVRTRRRAIGRSDKKLQKIATTAVASTTATATSTSESAKSKLWRAVAAMKGHHAFLHVQRSGPRVSVPTADSFGGNAHLAFLEFKRQHDETRAPVTVSMTELNASTKTPIRFGDQICLLSMESHVPLAVGADGHTLSVGNSVIGPHTIFTLLDFRDPSRRDDVRMGDDVWLRVDSSMLRLKEPRDDVLALVVDVHYFLGCPGWLEDAPTPSVARGLVPAHKTPNAYSVSDGDAMAALDTLKLAAMKAEVPAVDVYGDDQATREVAVETNASVLRLAKWRFASISRSRSLHAAADASGARVLNCATLCVLQSDFALEFDALRQRAVLRGGSRRGSRADASESKTSLDVTRRPSAAWQLRLVARPERERSEQATASAATAAGAGAGATSDGEWLARHEEQVARNARRIRDKSALATPQDERTGRVLS
ncbi:hypothetical protein PINS_up004740 [Pythium insidiosum]|nr:hypothetical protein PINS_up004740 [Pythium insidiosum]